MHASQISSTWQNHPQCSRPVPADTVGCCIGKVSAAPTRAPYVMSRLYVCLFTTAHAQPEILDAQPYHFLLLTASIQYFAKLYAHRKPGLYAGYKHFTAVNFHRLLIVMDVDYTQSHNAQCLDEILHFFHNVTVRLQQCTVRVNSFR